MKPSLEIVPSQRAIADYKRLLRAEWNERTLRSAAALLERQIREAGLDLTTGPAGAFIEIGHGARPQGIRVFDHLKEGVFPYLNLPEKPPRPRAAAAPNGETSSLLRRFAQAVAMLSLQSFFDVREGFIRDCQSLLFFASLHWLLPTLAGRRLFEQHDFLVKTLLFHTFLVWRDDASHRFYLEGCLRRYLEQFDQAQEALLDSFRLADPAEHDYLSKAQAYWFCLMEANKPDEALGFLLELYRNAPASLLAEIRQMIEAHARELKSRSAKALKS